MAKGMGLRLRLAVGLRLRLEMVSPLSPNWARRSQKIATVQQQSPFTLGRAECQRVASGGSGVGIGIDRLFNWLRVVFPIPPPVILLASSGASGVTSTRRIRDSDDV